AKPWQGWEELGLEGGEGAIIDLSLIACCG
ncbi:MAG: hypothetical protein RJB14_348, partial [Pseudomonadota bacterium]